MPAARLISCVLSSLALMACSAAQLYESGRDIARDRCSKEVGSDYRACIERTQDSYDDYARKRNQVLNPPSAR